MIIDLTIIFINFSCYTYSFITLSVICMSYTLIMNWATKLLWHFHIPFFFSHCKWNLLLLSKKKKWNLLLVPKDYVFGAFNWFTQMFVFFATDMLLQK